MVYRTTCDMEKYEVGLGAVRLVALFLRFSRLVHFCLPLMQISFCISYIETVFLVDGPRRHADVNYRFDQTYHFNPPTSTPTHRPRQTQVRHHHSDHMIHMFECDVPISFRYLQCGHGILFFDSVICCAFRFRRSFSGWSRFFFLLVAWYARCRS